MLSHFQIRVSQKCGGGGLVAKSYLTLATPWTVACQVPLSMGFFRQEYWSGLPFPSPGDLPDLWTEPMSSVSAALQTETLPAESSGKPNNADSCWKFKNLVQLFYFTSSCIRVIIIDS